MPIIIPQSEMDLVLNRKIRKRIIELPVRREPIRSARHPKTGRVLAAAVDAQGTVTRRCPVVEGGSYTLQARPEHERYDRWHAESERQPTRALAVLWLIDRCMEPRKTLRIVVRKVEQHGRAWIVHFQPDSERELADLLAADQPTFLGRGRDYTTAWDELGAGEVLMRSLDDVAAARRKARETRVSPAVEAAKLGVREAETHEQAMKNMKARNLIAQARRKYEAATRVLLSEETVDSDAHAA